MSGVEVRMLSAVIGFRSSLLASGDTETVRRTMGAVFKPTHLYVDPQSHGFTVRFAMIGCTYQDGIKDVPASAYGHNPLDYADGVLVELDKQRSMGAPVGMETVPVGMEISFAVQNDGTTSAAFVAALFGVALQ